MKRSRSSVVKLAMKLSVLILAAGLLLSLGVRAYAQQLTVLNVSYDPTPGIYQDYNAAFAKYWKAKTR